MVFNLMLALAAGGWVVTLIGAVLSVMAFDAPSAQGQWQAWGFVGGMCVLCLATLAAIIAAKWLFESERAAPALALLVVPAGVGAFALARKILG
ncbi:hypothetical protein [Microvirga solisilvae]|uniref:hypothetical protein n=1 Tax=Microvirga solisilvae TaxID=2919498 RepID=UPI001FAEECB0|nr:hypothetical protein [Microvirga solisilvae]